MQGKRRVGGILAGEAEALMCLGGGGEIERGEVGLVGVGGEYGGDLGDGGVVAADEVLGGVGDGRGQRLKN